MKPDTSPVPRNLCLHQVPSSGLALWSCEESRLPSSPWRGHKQPSHIVGLSHSPGGRLSWIQGTSMCLPSCDRPGTPGLPHLLNILWSVCVCVCVCVCVRVCVVGGSVCSLFSPFLQELAGSPTSPAGPFSPGSLHTVCMNNLIFNWESC